MPAIRSTLPTGDVRIDALLSGVAWATPTLTYHFTDDPAEFYDTKVREVWVELGAAADLVVGLRVDVTIDPEQTRPSSIATKEDDARNR